MYQNQKKYPNYQPSYKSYPTISADTANNLLFQPTLPSNQVAQNLNLYDKIYNQGGNDSTVQETPQIFGWETYPQSTIQGGQQVQEVSPLFNSGNSSQSTVQGGQSVYSDSYPYSDFQSLEVIENALPQWIDKRVRPSGDANDTSIKLYSTSYPSDGVMRLSTAQPQTAETPPQAGNPTKRQHKLEIQQRHHQKQEIQQNNNHQQQHNLKQRQEKAI